MKTLNVLIKVLIIINILAWGGAFKEKSHTQLKKEEIAELLKEEPFFTGETIIDANCINTA